MDNSNQFNSWILIWIIFFICLISILLCVLVNRGQFQAKCSHKQHDKWTRDRQSQWKLTVTSQTIKRKLGLTRTQRVCDICQLIMKEQQEPSKDEYASLGTTQSQQLDPSSEAQPSAHSSTDSQIDMPSPQTELLPKERVPVQHQHVSTGLSYLSTSTPTPSAHQHPEFQFDVPSTQSSFVQPLLTESLPQASKHGIDSMPSTSSKYEDKPHDHMQSQFLPHPQFTPSMSAQLPSFAKKFPGLDRTDFAPFQFPETPSNWCAITTSCSKIYTKLKMRLGEDPSIIKTITINSDGSWIVRIFGRPLNLLSQFPEFLTSQVAASLLQYIEELLLCSGNSDPRYIPLAESRGGDLPKARLEHYPVDDPITGTIRNSTIRHHNCPLVISSGHCCLDCSGYDSTLRSMLSRSNKQVSSDDSRTRADSRTPLSYLKPDELLIRAKELTKRLKVTRQSFTRLLKRTLGYQVTADAVNVEDEQTSKSLKQVLLEDVSAAIKTQPTDSFGHLFMEQQMKALQTDDPRGYRWHPMMIKWCLNLRMASSKAYDIVRNTIKLPSQQTLRRYIHWTDPRSGFTADAAKQLRNETKHFSDHQRYVTIVHDEMKISSDLVYNKNTGKLVGFVDLGDFENDMKDFEQELQKDTTPEKNLATYLLVFQVRGLLVNFAYPLAHFPTAGTRACEIFSLFWRAVEIVELAGLKVVAVTCDGASTNTRFFNMHGKTTPNPVSQALNPYRNRWTEDHSRNIFLLNDPPHLIKCVRNAWNNKARMLWNNGNIMWKQLEDLYYGDTEKGEGGLYMTKLTYDHISLTSYSKMKVGLAAQTVSSSVANALELNQGEAARAAVEFVRTFDKFFDLLNIRSMGEAIRERKDDKLPYRSVDDPRLIWLEKDFIGYLDKWARAVEERDPGKYTKVERKKMMIPDETLGGLRRSACGFPALTKFLLGVPGIDFVLSEKISQDKLEQLFGNVRQMKGGNESPNVSQVDSAMNVLRLKSSQDMKVLRGNTYDKRSIDELKVDDSPIPHKKYKKIDFVQLLTKAPRQSGCEVEIVKIYILIR